MQIKKHFLYVFLFFLVVFKQSFSFEISPQDAHIIGEKIWKNECAGRVEGLTHWKKGEDFPSLGIGHFIWYPFEKKGPFQETFPALLEFLQEKGAVFPIWLKISAPCPWNSREEFYADIDSLKMKTLRQFLFDTRSLQAIFMANRLESIFALLMQKESSSNSISVSLELLTSDPKGMYALLDYLNFKGSGLSPKETYKGQGWGLLQVLKSMPANSKQPLVDFVETAKATLRQRIQNSPPERNEGQWLKGWTNRLDSYKN